MPWLPDWITGYDAANAAAADAADRKRQELDTQAWQRGNLDLAEYQRRNTAGYGVDADQQRADIDTTFAESVKENASTISAGINSTLSFTLGKILGAVPLIVWLGAAVALFLWMGGGALLKGRLAR